MTIKDHIERHNKKTIAARIEEDLAKKAEERFKIDGIKSWSVFIKASLLSYFADSEKKENKKNQK